MAGERPAVKTTGSAWSVSFADATRYSQPSSVTEVQDLSAFNCGNHDSEASFQKMNLSLNEAERLRQQCRAAAASSAARNQEEKVTLDHHRSSINSAQDISEFSRNCLKPGQRSSSIDQGALGPLGHLLVQKPHIAVPSTDLNGVSLPGIVEEQPASGGPGGSDGGAAASGWEQPSSSRAGSQAGSQATDLESPMSPVSNHAASHGQSPSIAEAIREVEHDDYCRDQASVEADLQVNPLSIVTRESHSSQGEARDDSADLSSDSDDSDGWPPRGPLLRFKMRVQFSNAFKKSTHKAIFMKANEGLNDHFVDSRSEMKDMIVGWLNTVFELDIQTQLQFEIGFPIITLTMLDAIYPKRVRWREVDWRFQYKRALQKNFAVLETIWGEVNMEKAREFRVENTSLRLENMITSTLNDKLEFIRIMKKWFVQRIHHAGPYDPIAKRREYVEQCRAWGHTVKFPAWIKCDVEAKGRSSESQPRALAKAKDWHAMPEFKRLIWFLGSPEHQTM